MIRAMRRPMSGGRRGWRGSWIVIAWIALGGCSANVLHGIDERAANEATAALERAGIGAEEVGDDAAAPGAAGNFTVRVANGDASRGRDLIHAPGLPPRHRWRPWDRCASPPGLGRF